MEFDAGDELEGKVPKIADIAHGSPAENAGLKIGDRITRFGGRPITTAIQLAQALHLYPQDQEVAVSVQRGDQGVDVKLKLSALIPGDLGIKLVQPGKGDEYVRIAELAKDSPAQQAGLKPGDEIVGIDRAELKMAVDVQFQLLSAWLKQGVGAGDIARITIRRKGPDGKTAAQDVRIVAR